MFAFNMAIKMYLDDGHDALNFSKKLKELDTLQQHNLLSAGAPSLDI